MDDRWNILPDARRVQQHEDDSRPAWLWSQDGQTLIWSNAAAALFGAKLKKHGLKLAEPAVPIKGQVSRTIRLGSTGRTSLARIQFLAGEKPVSATCATTPLLRADGEAVLLIVGVDAIAPDVLDAARGADDALLTDAPPDDAQRALEQPEEQSPDALNASLLPDGTHLADAPPEAADESDSELDGVAVDAIADDGAYAAELNIWRDVDAETAYAPAEPHVPTTDSDHPSAWVEALGDAPVGAPDTAEPPADEPIIESGPTSTEAADALLPAESTDEEIESASRRLSTLVDRLAADEALFAPLNEADDLPPPAPDVPATDPDQQTEAMVGAFYKVTGRGFREHREEPSEPAATIDEPTPPDSSPDAEAVERVSRYNFDELSRILNDRVGDRRPSAQTAGGTDQVPVPSGAPSGALINLGGETLVLNRLPLGIMVFRDQQVLFANRAITEMVGYESVESLRQAGLAAIFPIMGEDGQDAGPVNHLVQRDGTLVPVTARLQSISWHGRPALMLSASTTEVRTGHEDAVKAFAQTFADIRGDGFLEASRNGMVSAANAPALTLIGGGKSIVGRSLASLVGEDDGVALRAFLERPARFAETARPCLTLRAADGKADLQLFALGQAGVVSGYFGLVNARQTAPARISGPEVDPALLGRISRGVRRPLNTVIGFSDIIRSKAFGALDNERYAAYADDIAQAGQEIAALVDELDDYARLRDGRYLPQRASLDLTDLLEQCVLRIRLQANAARVIVRNAISERLPRVTADRASLAQAVLNLLASAIDQTPVGGAVVISAQRHDDGSIAIQVRDSSAHAVDMAERFVVFRDGVGSDGRMLAPVRSSVGLALTRSLLAVNAVSLAVDPAGAEGLLFTLRIPADLVDERSSAQEAD
ncbi:sensor histidine kinase [Devosia sediminis]|uniref:histidine kinase n=1 Tax=Devosia sediminis TaxID=2798801 RepID=A0A934ITC2_9HYPH|nr:HAMP domain-containing sensor histidine kinase [Devosia sediminis]MBJ3784791.1 HAMP domain-containing histidine kinase [Devosia sediminis]